MTGTRNNPDSPAAIAALIPHQGSMCLLQCVVAWDDSTISCLSQSHLLPDNPLREGGRLGAVCGIEYALQAAALHGALLDGAAARPGYLAGLRAVTLHVPRLDDERFGTLHVSARMLLNSPGGMIYALSVTAEDGSMLVEGEASIVLPPTAT
ncbi:hypothetical protein [Granulibacter bethesdensis]|uniref:hypothetical protein n=1 Tax=Granulibacter bethesdensis TaxID=364410 RepID=UPI0003F1D488|nr:hypothetical protein [Granulibacter bethesdensis]AHJ64389.1 3-oxoacyl-[acyl-carrier protein] reductase [Granulibacter bethesdensis CGDNIH4]